MRTLIFLTIGLLTSIVAAQASPVAQPTLGDPSTWGLFWANTASLALLVAVIVQVTKEHITNAVGLPSTGKELARQVTITIWAILIGGILGVIGRVELLGLGPYYDGPFGEAVAFGLRAGFIASGAKALINSILEKLGVSLGAALRVGVTPRVQNEPQRPPAGSSAGSKKR